MKSLLAFILLCSPLALIKAQTCSFDGECNGALVGSPDFKTTEQECLDYCMTFPSCDYYSWCSDTQICSPKQTCAGFSGVSNCLSGERYCDRKTYTKMMVIGGPTPSGISKDVEVVDLGPGHLTCAKPADYPIQVWGATGAYFDGKPTVCGSTYLCYTYEVRRSLHNMWARGICTVLVQRFSEVTDQLGTAVLSVISGNPFLWPF